VYDLVPKVSRKLIFELFLLKFVDRLLHLKSDEELDPHQTCLQIVHEIVRGIVYGYVHV
jgi:hypothetical protein